MLRFSISASLSRPLFRVSTDVESDSCGTCGISHALRLADSAGESQTPHIPIPAEYAVFLTPCVFRLVGVCGVSDSCGICYTQRMRYTPYSASVERQGIYERCKDCECGETTHSQSLHLSVYFGLYFGIEKKLN